MKRDPNLTWKPVDSSSLRLEGTRAAIVGGTGGLGRELARLLAESGAQVIVVGQTFRDAGIPRLEFLKADLSSMREARRVAQELPAETLDLLVFTTGIFAAPKRQETVEGLERDMAVSYLNRLLMLRQMAPRLGTNRAAKTKPNLKPRVFVMGFPGSGQAGTLGDLNAEKAYAAMAVHMNTVAGNEMLVLDAAKRYPGLNVFGLNPGIIKTHIRDNFLGVGSFKSRFAEGLIGLLMISPQTYAKRIVPLLVSPDLEGHSGALFNQKALAVLPSPALADEAHVQEFLQESEALLARASA